MPHQIHMRSLDRAIKCPGSLPLIKHALPTYIDEESTEYKNARQLAHWALVKDLVYTEDTEEHRGANFFREAIYEQDGVSEYKMIDEVLQLRQFRVKVQVCYKKINDCTVHFYLYNYSHRNLEAYKNRLLTLLALRLEEEEPATIYRLFIIQPRVYSDSKIQTWEEHILDLNYEIPDEDFNESYYATGLHCITCPSRLYCEAFKSTAALQADAMPDLSAARPDPEQAGDELKFLHQAQKMIKARVDVLEEQVEHYLRTGHRVLNYGLEQGRGGHVWLYDPQIIIEMGKQEGIELQKKDAVITPTQALYKGLRKEIIDKYSTKIMGSLKLKEVTIGRLKNALSRK